MEADDRKSHIDAANTLVVKVGSRVLSSDDGTLNLQRIAHLADQLTQLVDQGKQVVLVSSGAVAAGIAKLGFRQRPTNIAQLQAVASVGQAHLIQSYERFFSERGRHAAQVLLTADDFDDRQRYLNVRNTLGSLLDLGVIPIINENDSVAVDELLTTFGDNDRLAAMVAGLFSKPALLILSDVDGLFDREPSDPDAKILSVVDQIDRSTFTLAACRPDNLSKGGMSSKLKAAQFATRSGAPVVIAGGRNEKVLLRIAAGEAVGTLFRPEPRGLSPKKRWIGFTAQAAGRLIVDEGAARALLKNGPSLLAIGIREIVGRFEKADVVSIRNEQDVEIARGLTNYNSEELEKIKGLRSAAILDVLGHCPYDEVVHRDNMALVDVPSGV